ncbi:MAG TPA: HAMP domain-containing sensor histidine kinase [Marmoricola sp.]|nr:HAMP domain-containing sensor histidine kinase [Marmoricola sp.]HNJ77759.1 HAMP domain-containing sensor histidine kinase [Marmoricola sp.]
MLLALTDKTTRGVVPGNLVMSLIPFLWNTMVWGVRVKPTRSRLLVVTVITQFGVGLCIYLSTGNEPATSVRLVLGHVLQGFLTAWIYREIRQRVHGRNRGSSSWDQRVLSRLDRGGRSGSSRRLEWAQQWSPAGPYDLVGLGAAVAAAIMLVTPIGVAPGVLLESAHWSVILTWWSLSFVTVFAGAACTLLLYGEYSRRELKWRNLLLISLPSGFAVAALYPVFVAQEIPSTWLLLVPSVWAGLSLRPWGAAVQALVLLLATAGFGQFQWFGAAYRTRLHTEVSIDLILVVCVMVGLALSLMQAELRAQKGEALEHAAVLELVLEEMSDGVIVQSEGQGFEFQNSASRDLVGDVLSSQENLPWAEQLGIQGSVEELANEAESGFVDHSPAGRTILLGSTQDGPEAGRVVSFRTRMVQRHGSSKVLVILRDISAQVQREEALKGFAQTAAHDLKGPIAALTGWLGLARELLREDDAAAADAALTRVQHTAHRMNQTVDDWLNYSIAREGRISLSPVDLGQLTSEVVETLCPPVADNPSAPWIVNDVRHQVLADRALTRQLLSNLISNSIKYHQPGRPLQITITSEAIAGQLVRVDVHDNGIGVPVGEERRIFDPFHRSPGTRDQVEGSGVGLAVCRAIVEQHGGHIWVSQAESGGAKFSFTLRECSS